MLKRLSLVLILLVSGALTWTLVQGATSIYSLNLTGAKLLQCGANVIEAWYSVSALDEFSNPLGSFGATQYFVTSNGGVTPQSVTLSHGATHSFYLTVGASGMSYAQIYLVSSANPAVRSNTLQINCDGSVLDLGGAVNAGGNLSADTRINWGQGDLINVLYRATDSAGKSGVAVYSLDANSVGLLEGVFAYDLFAPYLDNPPAQNTQLGTIDHSTLYALDSGEFQIVIRDPAEAKVYTVIFSAFPVSGVYFK